MFWTFGQHKWSTETCFSSVFFFIGLGNVFIHWVEFCDPNTWEDKKMAADPQIYKVVYLGEISIWGHLFNSFFVPEDYLNVMKLMMILIMPLLHYILTWSSKQKVRGLLFKEPKLWPTYRNNEIMPLSLTLLCEATSMRATRSSGQSSKCPRFRTASSVFWASPTKRRPTWRRGLSNTVRPLKF